MNLKFNWALIQTGATFHALVNILLLYEDPKTVVFTKDGADGGCGPQQPHAQARGWEPLVHLAWLDADVPADLATTQTRQRTPHLECRNPPSARVLEGRPQRVRTFRNVRGALVLLECSFSNSTLTDSRRMD